MRTEVQRLADLGTLPPESSSVSVIAECQARIEAISRPLTLDEATALASVLGDDDCFGLAWAVIHLIETAPGWDLEHVPENRRLLATELRDRIIRGRALQHGA